MADTITSAVTAQAVAGIRRENAQLHRSADELFRENQALRRQLFHVSAVLDVAVAKLNALGVSLEPPFDIRNLRAELKARSASWNPDQGTSTLRETVESQRKAEEAARSAASVGSNRKLRVQAEIKEHTRSVQCAAFCPDDKQPLIATGGIDKRIVVANFMTGAKVGVLDSVHDQNVSDVTWLNESTLASGSFDCTLKVTDVSMYGGPSPTSVAGCGAAAGTVSAATVPNSVSGAPAVVYQTSIRGFALGLCCLPDWPMTFAAVDSKKMVYICDTRTQRPVTQWECRARANSVAYDRSRRALVTGHNDGVVSLWDLRMAGAKRGGADLSFGASVVSRESSSLPLSTSLAQPLPNILTPSHAQLSCEGLVSSFPPPEDTDSTLRSPARSQPEPVAGSVAATPASQQAPTTTSPSIPLLTEFFNETSLSNVQHVSWYGGREDVGTSIPKLLVVSEDNMVRLYSSAGVNADSVAAGTATTTSSMPRHDFELVNVLSGLQTRSYSVRAAFWRGQRDKRGSSFFDDGERDLDAGATRHLVECDLVVCGGGENAACVYDVTPDANSTNGAAPLIQRLDGHRGRVIGAALHHSEAKPIVATFGEDAVVKIWVPSK